MSLLIQTYHFLLTVAKVLHFAGLFCPHRDRQFVIIVFSSFFFFLFVVDVVFFSN